MCIRNINDFFSSLLFLIIIFNYYFYFIYYYFFDEESANAYPQQKIDHGSPVSRNGSFVSDSESYDEWSGLVSVIGNTFLKPRIK